MAVKIRLRSQGTTNHVTYRLVVTDSRSPRDGKYLEAVGWYNPYAQEDHERVFLKADRIQHWLDHGAQMSDCAESLVKQIAPAITKALQEKRVKALQKRKKK